MHLESLLGYKAFKAKLWHLLQAPGCGRFVLIEGAASLGKCSMAQRLIFEWSSQAAIKLTPQSLHSGYSIEQMRELSTQIQEMGLVSSRIGYILDEANTLSIACVNALLKTLEELPSHVLVIAIALENPPLAATLRSRALKIRLTPQPEAAMRQWMQNQPELFGSSDFNLVLHVAQGSPGLAKKMVEGPFQERLRLYLTHFQAKDYTTSTKSADEIDAHIKGLESMSTSEALHEWVRLASYYWELNKLSWPLYSKWQASLAEGLEQLQRSTKLSHVLQMIWLKHSPFAR